MNNNPPTPWIQLTNGFVGECEGRFLLSRWCIEFEEASANAQTRKDLVEAKTYADEAIGIRSFAIEMLFTAFSPQDDPEWLKSTAQLIAKMGRKSRDQAFVTEQMDKLAIVWPGLQTCLLWCVTKANEPFNFYAWRFLRPAVFLSRPVEKSPVSCVPALKTLLEDCKTASQRAALEQLSAIEQTINEFRGRIGGFSARRAAWIVGPSGSGKNWVAQAFSTSLGMRTYSTTVGSWSLRNAHSGHSTIGEILRMLEAGPGVVIVDEICKIRLNQSNGSGNWWRAVQDEIMALSTGSLFDFGPSSNALANLRKSWILFAGAFQDLYRAKLGEVLFVEQVEDLSLSYEEIAASSWLPDELINRMGVLLEVRSAKAVELASAMKEIERECGVSVSPQSREAEAARCVMRMQGFRGLETYALRCGIEASTRRRSKKPASKPPQDPEWF